jgi:hypothetical protein
VRITVERTEKQQKKAIYNAIQGNVRSGYMERVSRGGYRLTPAGVARTEQMLGPVFVRKMKEAKRE